MAKKFTEITATKLEQIIHLPDTLTANLYVFRGQPNADLGLQSSLERAAEGIDANRWPRLEQTMILEFKRCAHQYLIHVPKDDDYLEWLALMQHHGCPTRLLDFTRSFYVALFFAVEETTEKSAVWALKVGEYSGTQRPALWEIPVSSTYDVDYEKQVIEILADPNNEQIQPGIIPVEPLRLNERISIQQGLFLFPKKVQLPFEKNLCSPLGGQSLADLCEQDGDLHVIKILIPRDLHDVIAYWLSMVNVTARSLFPGLDGFARSLATRIKRAKHETRILDELIRKAMQSVERVNLAFEGMETPKE